MSSVITRLPQKFSFHTKPRPYQLEQWERSREMEYYGSLWDMRLGKSKLIIDTMGWLYCMKRTMDAAIVVSKSNVCRNWQINELPLHMMPIMWDYTKVLIFQTRYAKTKRQERALEELINHPGFSILIISFDTFVTDAGKHAVWQMLSKREAFYTVDESARIKTPGTDRTRAIVKSSKYAPYRRIMTGTPFTNKGPFDGYSQMRFLHNKFWIKYGLRNFGMFKNFFGIWETKYNRKQAREYTAQVVNEETGEKVYQNIHLLKEWVDPYISRIMKTDFPEFIRNEYEKIYFELTPKQWKIYNQLKDELMVELDGMMLTASLAIVRLLRFQQITCGYLPDPDDPTGQGLIFLDEKNPRLKSLLEKIEDVNCQGIIWCRFTKDVDLILHELGNNAERYDGLVKEKDRPGVLARFKSGKFQWLVAKASCLGEGDNLSNAGVEIYYSNSFSLMERIQSEERPVLLDQKKGVVIVDMISDAPICEHLITTLRNHQSIADQITGDKLKSWI